MRKSKKQIIEETVSKLKELNQSTDREAKHGDADDVLCNLLKQLGYAEVVREYKKIDKWYS